MGFFIGIDIGTVSFKLVLLAERDSYSALKNKIQLNDLLIPIATGNIPLANDYTVLINRYLKHRGSPIETTRQFLGSLFSIISPEDCKGIRVCGSGGPLLAELLKVKNENEFRAIARGSGELYPDISTIFEMGGQNAKYISLERYDHSSEVSIKDYEKSGDCAAGTGSFIDQQAFRLKYTVEEIGDIAVGADRTAKIAGRCSVFAKSDMVHAQQKGYQPPEVLKGLCEAVARNFKSSIVKGKRFSKPVLFIGGVAVNNGVVQALRNILQLAENELIVPPTYAWMGAIGAALIEMKSSSADWQVNLTPLTLYSTKTISNQSSTPALSMDKVVLLRDEVKPRIIRENEKQIDAYLGIDVGSVSTNVALLDDNGDMIKEIYTRTDGRPIEVVSRCLQEIEFEFGNQLLIKGVGTTGSGRELIGELVGADTVNDEITAHKTGAEFLAKTMLKTQPDTIFEIGGQDSKYISIEKGVVVDFAMNEACAAGTGSFLEERAEELGISIKKEFAQLALSSRQPVKLGERCTVFMQQDVAVHQQRGADKTDLAAGLAYSIVYNYLNRVVRGRKIGEVIFFQGGTAYNDAIAAAFARVLNKEIIVPPYNGVIGAVGMALLAREKVMMTNTLSKFRGFNLEKVDYTLKEFTCKACTNFCQMQEFTVEGEKTYWGDQCSDKFRRHRADQQKPVIDDLLGLYRQLFFQEYDPDNPGKATIGFPRGMYIYEQFPFWYTFFRALNYRVRLSDESNARIVKSGIEACVAEPCLPIQGYHGHVRDLLEKKVDWLFIPNTINADTSFKNVNSYYCPWGQTLPFVLQSSPFFDEYAHKFISPPLRFREGPADLLAALTEHLKPLGEKKKDIEKALNLAYEKQRSVRQQLLAAGENALHRLQQSGEIGIVLVGRTYNVYDRGLTLDIGNKLRSYYGVNVIPVDFLSVDQVDISDINTNMYWNYGRKIIAAARIVGQYPNLHIIYITNFKCGPDSYVKHYITQASNKPFLTLQFDGHGNDAGYLTRCEAYLDSKGALRRWRTQSDSVMVESNFTEV
jgi:predicted CoA-substrate-specific enzyme activase